MSAPAPRLWNPPWWLGLLWGFAEGTFFFIIPDVLLSWASLASARGGCRMLAAILAGSLFGGFLMYQWAAAQPARSHAAVRAVPFVRERMFATVEADYQRRGASALLQGPGSGIPYKIYAVVAPSHVTLPAFLALSLPARLERLALGWLLCTALGVIFRRQISRHRTLTLALFGSFWVISYAIYWGNIVFR